MKYTLYHYRRIQGAWFNHGAVSFAATKLDARKLQRPRAYPEGEDHVYAWMLSADTAPKQIGCGPSGSFTLETAV